MELANSDFVAKHTKNMVIVFMANCNPNNLPTYEIHNGNQI